MKQSRWMSLVEAVTNVLVGYGVAVATQWVVFPLFGLHATLQENLVIGLVFTAVSLVRSYVLRRAFLDGRMGFLLAVSNAEGTYYRYVKLWLMQNPPLPGRDR